MAKHPIITVNGRPVEIQPLAEHELALKEARRIVGLAIKAGLWACTCKKHFRGWPETAANGHHKRACVYGGAVQFSKRFK